jgi:hypothetical protein
LFWTNDQSNFQPTCETLAMEPCKVKKDEKSKTETTTTTLRSAHSPFGSLPCSAGILRAVRVPMVFAGPALLLLSAPFSGTGTHVRALLLYGNPSDLGYHMASHPTTAKEEAESHLTKPNFLIANPELEFDLSLTETARYKFLIANK